MPPLTFSLVDLSLSPPPSSCVNKYRGIYVFIQCVTEGRGPETDKHLSPDPFTGQYLRKDDLKGLVSYSYFIHGLEVFD
jgi:hypothetical protein